MTRVDFSSPIPDLRDLRQRRHLWEREYELRGIDMQEAQQLQLLEDFAGYQQEFVFPEEATSDPFEFHFNNGFFEGLDAEVLHCMVRHFNPNKIIEVGCGNSTLISARAGREYCSPAPELVCIDPYPPPYIKSGAPGVSDLIETRVQDMDTSFFARLQANDILFIDSSHVVKTGSDVVYLYLEVLPSLQRGVIVHSHDIFLPIEYPQRWALEMHWFWNEQYLLQALLVGTSMFQILWAGHWMHLRHPEELKKAFPRYPKGCYPGSFWIRRS